MTGIRSGTGGQARFRNLAVALIVLVGLLAGGVALSAQRWDLAIVAFAVVLVGIPVANWIGRLRGSLTDDSSRNDVS